MRTNDQQAAQIGDLVVAASDEARTTYAMAVWENEGGSVAAEGSACGTLSRENGRGS